MLDKFKHFPLTKAEQKMLWIVSLVYQQRKYMYNRIEGKFGQGKNGYELNRIRARVQNTSESWIAAIFFIMNLIHLEKAGYFLSNFRKQLFCVLINIENMITQTINIGYFNFATAGSNFDSKNY